MFSGKQGELGASQKAAASAVPNECGTRCRNVHRATQRPGASSTAILSHGLRQLFRTTGIHQAWWREACPMLVQPSLL
jgi:hypothetical protein